ncbi:hypothetical protein IE53DRAFT_225789 [Violaceomyces palustris]|uniref:Uncharacterized protein n=1 Tax=Violaceomyces palustris TaxID=1673888 RepID=A0ACD0NPW0_9BASI|nr:hypothetical protein IE53DRAFT_225789 [Violaceomyces palustris]
MLNASLYRATASQDLEATRRESVEWGRPLLDEKEFVERERQLAETRFGHPSRRRRWVMRIPSSDSEDFLSSCETYRRKLIVYRPGSVSPNEDGGREAGMGGVLSYEMGYSICSVFVPEEKRGRGHASLMMTLLHQELNRNGTVPTPFQPSRMTELAQNADLEDGYYGRDAILSFLYSDVGDFYEPYGWQVKDPFHLDWKVVAREGGEGEGPRQQDIDQEEGRMSFFPVREDDIPELAFKDEAMLRRDIQKPSKRSKGGEKAIRFAVSDPEGSSWLWLIKRSKFYANFLKPEQGVPDIWGARLRPSSEGQDESFIVWNYDYTPGHEEMDVLRLRFDDMDQLRSLINIAQIYAGKYGMKKLKAWNVDLDIGEDQGVELSFEEATRKAFEKVSGATLVKRSGASSSLPAVAWYGGSLRGTSLDWVANEKGWWC